MDKNQLVNKIATLTDNMNKKIRKFRANETGDFYENKLNYATAKFDKKINLTMESGFMTKSKKEIGKLTNKELQSLYENLQGVNNNKDYGTVKKFKKTEIVQLGKSASTMKSMIGEERFNKLMGEKSEVEFMKEYIARKQEMNNARGSTYSSNQILMDMLLLVPNDEDEKKDIMRAVNKMERARELMNRNVETMKGRRKNGNR